MTGPPPHLALTAAVGAPFPQLSWAVLLHPLLQAPPPAELLLLGRLHLSLEGGGVRPCQGGEVLAVHPQEGEVLVALVVPSQGG